MKTTALFATKAMALWIILIVAQMVGGVVMLVFTPPPPAFEDGPLTTAQAVPIVAALQALVLAFIASRLRGPSSQRLGVLFVVFYLVASGQSLIEAWYFNDYLKLEDSLLLGLTIGDIVRCILIALAAWGLWRKADTETTALSGLAWKLPVLSLLYVVTYFAAGAWIAWQSPYLRAYYAEGMQIDQAQLAGLQVLRGAVWAGIALLLARGLSGTTLSRGLLTGAAFSVFMAATLLIPAFFMPWEVRSYHLVEVGLSNFVYGVIAVMVLMIGGAKNS